MSKSIRSISDILSSSKEFDNFRKAAKESDVINRFFEIMPGLKEVAEPVKIEKKVLFLKVQNSVWRSELFLKQKSLTSKINVFFNEDLVKTIRFISK